MITITLNGVTQTISETTAFSCYQGVQNADGTPTNTVVVLNGFALSQDRMLSDGDILTVIPKGEMPPRDQLESMMAARHTPGVHQKLKQGRVAIAGLGGLGSNIAISLARVGVGQLLLVDFDTVEPSNLNRQSYQLQQLGQPKTQALAQQIQSINPFITVQTETVRITAQNVAALFEDVSILCEALDQPTEKAMLITTALRELPQVKIVAASGMAGFDSANSIITAKKRANLYLCGDESTEACIGVGLMAPRVLVCAGHQANMIVRLLLGKTDA